MALWRYSSSEYFMQNVEKAKEAGTISVADADRMTGEAHFARAYMYYGLVKDMAAFL